MAIASFAAALLVAAQTMSLAAFDRHAVESNCQTQWGTLRPLVVRCIEAQGAAFGRMNAMQREASKEADWKAMMRGCVVGQDARYDELSNCFYQYVEGEKANKEEANLWMLGNWPKIEGVPSGTMSEIVSACGNANAYKYSQTVHCIDYSTVNWRRSNQP
jgi:hypothetical protein